jgi:Holliday junction resolvasome RuvABC DNA-binding subunit
VVKTMSYVIIALHKLGYTLEEIQAVRKEIQREFDEYGTEEAERQAVHIMGELLLQGREQIENQAY